MSLGTLAGGVLGIWLAGEFAAAVRPVLSVPRRFLPSRPRGPPDGGAASGGAALVGALGAVRRVAGPSSGRGDEARDARPSSAPGLLDRINLQVSVPLVARTIARNIQRQPARALLAVVGLALAVGLTLSGRYMFDAIEFMRRLGILRSLAAGPDGRVRAAARRLGALGIGPAAGSLPCGAGTDVPVRLRNGAAAERTAIQGLEEGAWLRRIMGPDRERMIVPPGGLLLSAILARRLHVGPGDTLSVEVLLGRGRCCACRWPASSRSCSVYRCTCGSTLCTAPCGRRPTATVAFLAVDPEARASVNARLKRIRPSATRSGSMSFGRASSRRSPRASGSRSRASCSSRSSSPAGWSTTPPGCALAERGRELASLRVLGFTRGEVAAMLLGEQAVLTLAAIPVGLATGWGCVGWCRRDTCPMCSGSRLSSAVPAR